MTSTPKKCTLTIAAEGCSSQLAPDPPWLAPLVVTDVASVSVPKLWLWPWVEHNVLILAVISVCAFQNDVRITS